MRCPSCNGTGYFPHIVLVNINGEFPVVCEWCNATGTVDEVRLLEYISDWQSIEKERDEYRDSIQ